MTIITLVALTYRFAAARDVPAIVALIDAAFRGVGSAAGWTSETALLDGKRTDYGTVLAAVHTAGSAMLLAEAGGRLAGCCLLDRYPDAEVCISMFAVQPSLQRHGCGREILAEAERFARDDWTARSMVMTVIAQRQELIAWYVRRGYRPTGECRPFPYGDDSVGVPLRPDLSFAVLAKQLAAG